MQSHQCIYLKRKIAKVSELSIQLKKLEKEEHTKTKENRRKKNISQIKVIKSCINTYNTDINEKVRGYLEQFYGNRFKNAHSTDS